jgi:AcrR family transcriptional regulator
MVNDVSSSMGPRGLRRGRGARERLLAAAAEQFRIRGIKETTMDQLCAAAGVSKRTSYQYFDTKDDLVVAYLQTRDLDALPGQFRRPDLSPRDQLLAVFAPASEFSPTPLCPFIAAAVETRDPSSVVRMTASAYKQAVADRLTTIAREAGATHPELLGEQLALLLDGASSRTHVTGVETLPIATAIATTLVDAALPVHT